MKVKKLVRSAAMLSILALFLVPLLLPLKTAAQIRYDNIDVILVVDNSASMEDNDPGNIRLSAARLFVDLCDEGDQVAVVSMGAEEKTGVVMELTETSKWLDYSAIGRKALKEQMDDLTDTPRGGTFMGTALRHAYEILDNTPPGRRQFIVLLTDGVPEVENPEVLASALNDFERKRFWKIFPIALGEGADFEYLKREVAGRTGGRAYKATTAPELIRIYTEIFALLRYNRYVNWVTVQPNALQTLGTINREERITNLALVIPKEGDDPFIDVVISPNQTNIVDPAVSGSVYHADDKDFTPNPRYECFVMEKEQVLLDGEWRIRLNSNHPIEVAVLVRSDYGIQLLSPPPQASWDELSSRYAPQGTPLYIHTAVRNAEVPYEERGDDFYNLASPQGRPEPLLRPVTNMEAPAWDPITLRDDGAQEDVLRDDGLYAGLYRVPEGPGEYVIQVEVPSSKLDPVRLVKRRVIEVRPLPTIRLELPPPQVSQQNAPIPIKVLFQPPEGQFIPVNSADVTVAVKDPRTQATVLTAEPEADHYATTFVPMMAGVHQMVALATIRVTQEEGEIVYDTVALGSYEVVFPGRNLVITSQATDLGQRDRFENATVTVDIASDSPDTEKLNVQVEGLPGGTVSPTSIDVPPKQTTTFDFLVGSTSLVEVGTGQFQLVFTSPEGKATVQNGVVTYSYSIAQIIEVWADETDKTLEVDSTKGMPATVRVWSEATGDQTLEASVEGLEGATVMPKTVTVPPREESAFTFSVSAGPDAPDEGQFTLVLTAPGGAVEVIDGQVTYTYSVTFPVGPIICLCAVVLVIVGGAGFFVWRRSKSRRRR